MFVCLCAAIVPPALRGSRLLGCCGAAQADKTSVAAAPGEAEEGPTQTGASTCVCVYVFTLPFP